MDTELTNAVSHELKTPLSRLHYALELQKTSTSDLEKEKYTQKIESNIVALEKLVNELLSYTRLQTSQTLNLESHQLNPWLEKELEEFSEYHPDLEIKLTCNDKIEAVFDEFLLSRAFNNLLENAVNFADKNNPLLKVTATVNNSQSSIIIEDNGIGIIRENRERIFKPFLRLDGSRQRHKSSGSLDGYGIGLSIVKRVMLQHKGEVVCSSSNLGGAKFTLIW